MDLATFGNGVLSLALVLCTYAFATAVLAGRGRAGMLVAARYGTYATAAALALALVTLAYAFQTHDFSIRYVARYSDRSMPPIYLVASLWGGQDGSLLWWAFLLCGYTVACVRWMRQRYFLLQPYVLATLLSILGFFLLLMLFAANPFATQMAAAPADGEGLNPLLQNYWMAIHPPSLYLGFVGWSVPFAFAIAGLITGRLDEEWMVAARKWSLVAWLFLSIGLLLGMLWSYEELGWGGYWAWDPVENASFHPWLVGTAYLHSVMVQERYRMLKVWNVFLICLTFFMTIFGTFLTRSGLIASVHSFARSDIGIWFVWYMVFLVVVCTGAVVARRRKLRPANRIDHLLSREFAFLLNNWMLLGIMLFVVIATTFPLLSEWLKGEEVTVGPPFYNAWLVPAGIALLALLGIGPLIAWRKATGRHLLRAFLWPGLTGLVTAVLHLALGERLGFPARVEAATVQGGGPLLARISEFAPLLSVSLCLLVLATIAQEFLRGTRVRMRRGEDAFTALFRLVARAKRRYGGYVVHAGIVFMYLGWTGAAYDIEQEGLVRPGETLSVGGHTLRYEGARYEQDTHKKMLFADLSVLEDGAPAGHISPAKFIYRTHPEMPTTEVAIRSSPLEDLYVILSTVDTATQRATLRVIVRPFVFWIWAGGILLIFGVAIAIAPTVKDLLAIDERALLHKVRIPTYEALATAGTVLVLAALMALWPVIRTRMPPPSGAVALEVG